MRRVKISLLASFLGFLMRGAFADGLRDGIAAMIPDDCKIGFRDHYIDLRCTSPRVAFPSF